MMVVFLDVSVIYVNCLGDCKLDFYYVDIYGEEEVEVDE